MIGRAMPLSQVHMNHRWINYLKSMGVSKVGAYVPEGTDTDFLSQLITGADYGLPKSFVYCLVTYLGFGVRPHGLVFRNLEDKDFRIADFGMRKIMFYVSQRFDENIIAFKYGYPIVLVEGVLDTEAFAALTGYPFVVAYLTSFVNPFTAAFFSTLTNKIMLVPDQDKSAQDNVGKTLDHFKMFGTKVEVFKTSQKDFGDLYTYRDTLESARAESMLRNM